MSRTITTPEVVIDGALPRTALERIYRIADFAISDNDKIKRLLNEAQRAGDDNWPEMHEVEEDLLDAINAQYANGAVIVPGVDPGDLILYPTNEDGLPVDENGELLPDD